MGGGYPVHAAQTLENFFLPNHEKRLRLPGNNFPAEVYMYNGPPVST